MTEEQAIIQLKKIFRDNIFRRDVLSTSGRVNFNRLGMHKTSKNLFSRPDGSEKGNKYNIEILLDDSGSMYNDRAEQAHLACYNIIRALKSLTNLNLTLFNYTETRVNINDFTPTSHKLCGISQARKEYYYSVKEGDVETIISAQPSNYDNCESKYGGNWEIVNLLNAVNRLNKEKGEKIVIMLCDGCPSLDDHNVRKDKNLIIAGVNTKYYTRDVYASQVKKMLGDKIKMITIGIGTNSPEAYYPNFYLCDDPNNIYSILVESLTKTIKK